MIEWEGKGDLFDATATHTLLCPINAVGAMGKGLALAMRQRFPGLWQVYFQHYHRNGPTDLTLTQRAELLTHVEMPEYKVLLLCTKYQWWEPSPLALVEGNLKRLAEQWEQLGIHRLALPMIGCGEGRLPPKQVRELIHTHLGPLALPARLYT